MDHSYIGICVGYYSKHILATLMREFFQKCLDSLFDVFVEPIINLLVFLIGYVTPYYLEYYSFFSITWIVGGVGFLVGNVASHNRDRMDETISVGMLGFGLILIGFTSLFYNKLFLS
jgi:hypothetical protein